MNVFAHRMTRFFVIAAVIVAYAAAAGDSWGQPAWQEHLRVLNDETVSHDELLEAEAALLKLQDVEILRAVFKIIGEPIGDWDSTKPMPWPVALPHRPTAALIPSARLRVFEHFAKNAQPEADRKRIFAELFDEFQTELEFRQLLLYAVHNRSSQLEQKLWSLFADRERESSIRARVVGVLSRVADSRYGHRIIAYAWEERGSEVAMSIGTWVTHHPLQNVLMLDWYDRERSPETQRSSMPMSDMLDRLDRSFGNISGMYVEHRVQQENAIAIVRQRNALQEEARLTGDDTQLRAFEAKLAAKQQAELEERIEKIDAWIAANRDRLEQEAADFARHREEERQRHEQPQREQPPTREKCTPTTPSPSP